MPGNDAALDMDHLAEAPYLRLDRVADIARWNEELDAVISNSLRAGVLGVEDSRYSIPIPSFADHLLRT